MAPEAETSPTAQPLSTFHELLTWTQGLRKNVAHVALSGDRSWKGHLREGADVQNAEGRPRLLVCHDLQGGYQDDRWLEGGTNADAYRIWHWRPIDVFVYFSHHLVTVPPACWTNTAHRNGVKVLGTFITEWDEGAAICSELLSSVDTAQHVADQLVAVAAFHKFDGWLLNIENEVEAAQIPTLVGFVKYLTERMHQVQPGAEVIWYDSVTTEGKLVWQDGLTPLNEPFFAAADGLFVNYTWKEETPKECAKAAGSRAANVFMGVDVFGRGTFGGGKYDAGKGLSAARTAGVSAALFAPGWVIECPGEAGSNFEHAQEKFWGLIGDCWPATWPTVVALPFQTDFNQGVGHRFWSDGVLVSDCPWNNLSLQSLQPLHHHARLQSAKRGTLLEARISFDRGFSGGSSYKICGSLDEDDSAAVRLFDCGVELPPAQSPLVSFTASALPGCYVTLLLRIELPNGGLITAVCDSSFPEEVLTTEDRSTPSRKHTAGLGMDSLVESGQTEVRNPGEGRGKEVSSGPWKGKASGKTRRPEQGTEQFEARLSRVSETEPLLWADRLRSSLHTDGWQTNEYVLTPAQVADGGRLTDVGVVCHRGSDDHLRTQGLWECMKERTEDAWRHRNWDGQRATESERDRTDVKQEESLRLDDQELAERSLGRKMLDKSLQGQNWSEHSSLQQSRHDYPQEGSEFSIYIGQVKMQFK